MTRKRLARRHGRRVSDPEFDRDSTQPDDAPDALVTSYFGSAPEERGRGSSHGSERAVGQLRREIERTLTCSLAAARDPRLRDLMILGVDPAPDASCFQVTVATLEPLTPDARAALAECLHAARGELRAEIARSLQRKRTPELRFVIGASGDRTQEAGAP
jgi:ribosome-binding factor A